jgi:hypothetical protein
MTLARACGVVINGVEGLVVDIEAYLSQGLPGMAMLACLILQLVKLGIEFALRFKTVNCLGHPNAELPWVFHPHLFISAGRHLI